MVSSRKPLGPAKIVLYSVAETGSGVVNSFANSALPLFLGSYGVPNWAIGVLAQERSLAGAVVQPLVGALSDRLPASRLGRRRPFFLVGVPLTVLSLLFLSSHPSAAAALAVLTLFAFFVNVAYDPYLALLVDIAPIEQRPQIGGFQIAFRTAGHLSLLVTAFLLWRVHQPLVFIIAAVVLPLAFGVTFFGIKEPSGDAWPRSGARMRFAPRAYLADLAGRRELLKYLAVTFFLWFGVGGLLPFQTRWGVQDLHLAANVAFTLGVPLALGNIAMGVLTGRFAQRFGKKRVMGAGLLVVGTCLSVAVPLIRTYPQALALLFIIGLASGPMMALVFPLFSELIPAERAGELTGIGSTVWSISQPIGALVAGLAADATGAIRGAFLAGGVALLVALAILLTVRVAPSPVLSQRDERHPLLDDAPLAPAVNLT